MAVNIRPFEAEDQPELIEMWQRSGITRPANDPVKDIHFCLSSTNSEILVGEVDGRVVASVMLGHDGHRGTVYYVAVDPNHRRRGFGAMIMQAAEAWLTERGVWKINLMIRADNTEVEGFYRAIGYQRQELVVMTRRFDDV